MEPPPTIQEAEMPMPLNSTYSGSQSHPHPPHAHGLMTHHHHHHHHNPHPIASPQIPPAGPALDEEDDDEDDDEDDYNNNDDDITINHHQVVVPFRKPPAAAASARYRECLRNHAAAMGGNATDGCGEFMPGGSGGDALTCSACGCHRNFHRKETEGEPSHNNSDPRMGRKVYLGHHHHHQHRALFLGQEAYQAHHIPTRPQHVGPHPHHHQMLMPYGISESEEMEMRAPQGGRAAAKKRFRTKFSQEQKEKMLGFAERVGWKIQKQEEAVVQQFCQEVGVKRRVLKVWMHNNKHSLAKKNNAITQHPNSEQADDGHQIVNNSNDNRVN